MSRSHGRNRATRRLRLTSPSWMSERHGEWRLRWNRSLLMGSTGLGGVLAGLALGAGSAWSQMAPNTLPTGGQVVAGSATINQANPSTLNITQSTSRAVINWNSFDVGSSASVNFYQPDASSWTLNRVTNSASPSQILGSITANGNIAVINPNGVIFGAGSRIDVNGLIATTANITDQNFMAGTMKFDQAGNPTATVSNFGDITVKDAGLVAFVAPGVQNSGTITARLGTVSLAAGQRFTIDLYGDKLVSIATDGAVDQAPVGPDGKPLASLVDNSGKIVADGGQVLLTARQASRIVDTAVNMSGVVQAQSAYVDKNGDIVLDAGPAGDVKVTGTLDASGRTPGAKGGSITVTGKDTVQIGGTAKLDASGDVGGGKIKIGGDFHGQGTTPTAKRTTVAAGAQIKADAVTAGNGGQVVVWGDQATEYYGNISARGGAISGNGGSVEVSGADGLLYSGKTDTRADHGLTGTLLLDPLSLTISNAPDALGNINDATLSGELGTTNVTLQTQVDGVSTPGSDDGHIVFQTGANVTWTSGSVLALVTNNSTGGNIGAGSVDIQSGVTISAVGGHLVFNTGTVTLSSNILTDISNSGTVHDVYVTNSDASVQDGIDAVAVNGTVHLADNTTWNEAVLIKIGLTLQGGTNSVLDGSSLSGSVITVQAQDPLPGNNNVIVDHVGVVGNSSTLSVVRVLAANNFSFTNGNVTGTGSSNTANGIDLAVDPGNSTVTGNVTIGNSTISNTGGIAILTENAGGVVIDGNLIYDTVQGIVVRTQNWMSAEIVGNDIGTSGGSMLTGIVLSQGDGLGAPITVSGNTIGKSGVGLITGTAGILIDTNAAGGTVSGNTVSGVFADGLYLSSTLGSLTVDGNTVNHTGTAGNGIHVGAVGNLTQGGITLSNNIVTGDTIGGATNGIFVDSGTIALGNVQIIGNTISLLGGDGIKVDPVFGPVVFGNVVFNVGGSGIEIDSASGSVSVANNTVNATGSHGIYIHDTSGTSGDTISIAGNTIGNDNGLGTISGGGIGGNGIFVDGGTLSYGGETHIEGNRVGVDADGTFGTLVAGPIGGSGVAVQNMPTVAIVGNSINGAAGDGIDVQAADIAVINANYVAATPDGLSTIAGNGISFSSIGSVTIDSNSIGVNDLESEIVIGGHAISGSGGAVQAITNNVIGAGEERDSWIGGYAITISGAGTSTISGNAISNTGYNTTLGAGVGGIYWSGDSVSITDNIVFNFAGDGIGVAGGTQALIDGNSVTHHHGTVASNGVVASSVGGLTITNNAVGSVDQAGIVVDGATALTIGASGAGNTIDNVGGNGISVTNVVGPLEIGYNRIGTGSGSTIGANGISYGAGLGSVTIEQNVVSNAASIGIEVDAPTGSVTVAGNTLNAIGGHAIYVHDMSSVSGSDVVTIAGNAIGNNKAAGTVAGGGIGGDGILVDGGSGTFEGAIHIAGNKLGVDLDGVGGAVAGTIAGNGIEATNLQGATVASNTVNGTGQDGIHLSSIGVAAVDGNNIGGTQDGAVAGDGIDFANIGQAWITNNDIGFDGLDSDIAIGGDGIHGAGGTSLTISGNSIGGGDAFSSFVAGAGITVSGAGDTTISQNAIRNVGGVSHGGAIHWSGSGSVGITVTDNTVFNYGGDGISVSSASQGLIDGNDVRSHANSTGTGNAVAADDIGTLTIVSNLVAGTNGAGITVSNSGTVTIGGVGAGNRVDFIQGDAIDVSGSSGSVDVGGNTIGGLADLGGTGTIGGNGIAVVSTGGTANVADNTLAAVAGFGILLRRDGDATVSGNTIAAASGIAVHANSGGTASVDGNTISGASGYGIDITDDDDSGFKFDTHVELSGNTIGLTGTAVGIRVLDNSTIVPGVAATVEIGSGNSVTGGATGLRVDGANTSLAGNTLSDIVFTGQSGNYVELLNGGLDNMLIDGRGATYDGVLGSAANASQVTAIEAKIIDVAEDSGVGDIVVNNSLIIVDGGTLQTIQDALDFGAGAHITVEAGTYGGAISSTHSSGGALTIWADDVILQGSGAPTLNFFSTAGANAVAISGARATFAGFAAIDTGSITGSVVLVSTTGGGATVSGNTITVGNSGAHGIQVQASDVGILGNEVTTAGSTLGNGIFVDSGSSTLTGIVVSGNTVAGFAGAGILIDPTEDPIVTGNTVTGPGTIGIEVADAIGSVTVTGNYVDNVTTGISVHDTTGDSGDTITIGGNTIGRNSILSPTTGITLANNNIGGTIASNSVSVSGDGIDVAAGGQAWSVSDNSVSTSGANATLLYVSGAGQLAVEDNFFGGKSIGGSANGIVVDVDAALAGHILIGGNTVQSVKGNGVLINGSTIANATYTVTGNTLFLAGGNGVHINGGGAGTTVTVSSNSIAGGGTTASFGTGILIDSGAATFAGATVSDNAISGFNGNGIYIDPVFGPVVTGNDISSVVDNGIEVVNPVGGATILSNTINATGENAIYVHGATGAAGDLITIAGNTIGNDNALGTIGGGGIVGDGNSSFLGDIVVGNNRIGIDTDGAGTLTPGAAAGSGISLVDSGGGVTVSGNTIANPVQNGITIANAAGQVDVGGNTVSGSGQNLVDIRSSDGGVSVHDNVLSNSLANGIAVFASSTIDIVGNATTNISGTHIFVQQVDGGGLVIAGNTLTTGGGDAIRLEGNISGGATIGSATIGAASFGGNTITGFNFTAIDVVGPVSGDLSVNGNTIAVAQNGIQSTATVTGNVLVDGNTIDNIATDAITISGVGGTLAIADNRIASVVAGSTVGGNAISATNVVGVTTIGGNHIGDNSGAGGIGGIGIAMTGLNADLSVFGNTIGDANSTIGGNGISISGALSAANVTIQSNTVANFGAAGTAAGIYVADISDFGVVALYANRIHDGSGDGIFLSGDSTPIVGAPGLGNIIDNVGGNGIYAAGAADLRADSNLIGTAGTIAQNGITVNGGTNVAIVDNTIGYDSTGTVVVIGQSGVATNAVNNLTIDGNTIGGGITNDSRIGGNGIFVANTGGKAVVSNNLVRNTGYSDANADGIHSESTAFISVTGNSVFNVADNGVQVTGGAGVLIDSNHIDNNHDARGTTIGSGISASGANHVTVTNNTVSDTAKYGVTLSGWSTARVGVTGAGNTISNADAGGVWIDGTGDSTVSGNTISATPIGVGIYAPGSSTTISYNRITVSGVASAAGVTIGGNTAPAQILFNDVEGLSAGTGIDLADGQFTIANNNVNGFGTGLHVASGTTVGNASSITNLVFGNNFSGNTIGVDHEGSGVIQASGNYWGFTDDGAGFQAYFAHNAVLGTGTGKIDVTPFLVDGTDGNGATVGFVGNFHQLYVTALGSELSGATVVTHGRIQEAVDLIPAGVGTNSIEIGSGTFLDNVTINRADITNLKLFGQGGASTTIDGFVNAQAVISVTAISIANAGDLTLQDFAVTGTSGGSADGIVTSTISHVLVDGVYATSLTNAIGFDFVGGSDIVVTGASIGPGVGKDGVSFNGSSNVSVTASTIAGAGRDGIAVVSVTGGTIGNNVSIGGATRDGIRVLDSTGVSIGNGVSINAAGRDGVRVQADGPNASVSLGGVTIVNATDNGVDVIAGGGGTASVAFTGGTSISNNVAGAFNAVRVQGANASFTLPTPDGTTDLSLNIDAGDSLQNYFLLTNSAMGGTVTLGYDVNFIGLTGTLSSLQTYGLTAATLSADQIAALFQIEDHMVHAVDNTSLGLIRLVPDALFPTVGGGLNGVRNAIVLSSSNPLAQDTVFLQAGDYADPSNLAGGGIVIDRNIRLVGAQAGVAASGRDPTDSGSETILDFNSATVSPNNGIRITDPAGGAGVLIDGVVVQVGSNQGYGIRIDSGAARDNISIVNSFVRGMSGNNATGDGIQTAGGSSTINGVTISGDVIEYFNGDGVDLANVGGLVLQNNVIRNVAGRGIDVTGSGFASSLSGNVLSGIGLDGIRVQNAITAVVIDGNVVADTAAGDGIEVDGATMGATIVGNSIAATSGNVTINGNGILVDDTTAGGVLVSGNLVGTAEGSKVTGDGIHVQDTVLGGVSVSLNTIGSDRPGALVSGDGIQIVDTGVGGSGNVFVLSNSIQHTGGDGVFVDPTIGDVTVNGQNILSVGGNGIRVFQTTGKVTVGDTGAGNTVNATGRNGIVVDTTGEVPGPVTGTGGVTVSYNIVGNLAGSTIGSAGSFDGIVVTDTLRGNVLVANNSVAAGNNVVVTRQGIYVVDTAGQGATGGNVTVQGNTVAAGAGTSIANSGILVDNTTLGSVFVSDNAIALGDGAAIGSDAIRVQDTGADASVAGNTIGNSTTAIGAEGIEVIGTTGTANVDGNTVFNVSEVGVRLDNNGHATVSDNTIDATGQAGILVLDTANGVLVDANRVGSQPGSSINGAGIFIDQTAAGSVTVSNNQVATGAGATLASDAIHVDHTSLGDVLVLSNKLGNAGFANPNEGIDVANTSAGGVTVNSNSIVNFQGFGIHVAQTYGMVAVGSGSLSGNTIDLTGLDGIRVNNTGVNGGPGGVLVGGNLIGSMASSTIGGLGIFVDQTAAGSVTVSANSVATGAGTVLGNDGIRVDHTSLGNVFVLSNKLGNAGFANPNEGIDVANTSAGGVTVNGNSIVNFQGFGIHVAQTYGMVAVGTGSLSGNTIDLTGLDGIRVNNTGVNGGPGGVLVGGNIVADSATIGSSGIVVMDSNAGNVTVSGNSVGQGGHILGDGIRVTGTSLGGVTVSSNRVGSSVSGAGIDNDGIQVTNTGLGVLLDGNSVTNVGFVGGNGRGIVINITGLSGNGDSTIGNSTVSGTGGVGILAQSIGGNLLANTASVSHTGDSGIRVDHAGNVTASNLTIDSAGNHGLHLRNIANGTVTGVTITNAANDGLRLSRPDGTAPSMAVSVSNVTIDGAGAVGLRLLDNDGTIGGGTIALQVGSGVSIANAPIGLIVDGPDTRNIGKSLNDMSFANIGSGSGYYIELRNAGWYEDDSTPNGAFNPTQIDATHVSFDGVVAGSLDPADNLADVTTLANLELRLYHFLDDPTLGLIRLQSHAIALPEMGLNGIQLADYASANGDSIYLIAGTYGDPSSLVPGGLIIDKQISLVGWQHGVSAKTGGRDGVTDETILDFAGATIAPSAGIVIKESNVTIDGVVVQLDASQVNGGIVVDTSVARSNIDIVNNFVHGTSIAFGGGAGILTSGGGTVTNLNVSDNVVEFVTGNGISIDHGQNLTIQNNVLGNAGYGAPNVNYGIFVTNSSFGAPVSGNVVNWTGASGISLDGITGSVTIADNSLANTALSGIGVQNAGDTYITGNRLTSIGLAGIAAASVANVTIGDNTVAQTGGVGIVADYADSVRVLDNSVNASGLWGISVSHSPSVDIEGNSVYGAGFHGILASSVGGVTIASNSVGGSMFNGIEVQYADGTSIMGNTLAYNGQDGIVAVSVGNVTVADNTLSYSGGNGIVVEAANDVRVLDNTSSYQTLDAVHIDGVAASTVAGNSLSYAGGDGIDLANGGATTISGNGVSYAVGNGVVVNTVGQLDIVDNSVGNTTLAGITVYNAADTDISGNSVFYALGGDGIAAVSVGGLTIAGNDVEYASANGITVFHAGDLSVGDNTVRYATLDGIAAVSVGNTTVSDNLVAGSTLAGITLGFAGDVSVLTNTVTAPGADAIDVTDSGATSISGNTIGSGGAKGIYATGIHGGLTVLNNDLDTIAGNGIEASTVFGDVTVSSNVLHDVALTGIRTSNTGNVQANGNSLDLIGGDGIVISLATSDASVQGNTLSHVSGNGIIVGQLTDTTITGNVLSSIAGTGIAASQVNDATVGGNSLSDIGNDGINLSQANDLVVGANQMARVAGDGIDIALAHDVTVVANILDDTGHGAGGAAVRLDNYTMATIVGNSIVSLTAMTGIAISNGTVVTYPQGNTTIAGNLISGNEIGIGTSGEVLGTITGNTITGNSQWGIVVGAGLTQTHLEGSMTLLDLLVTGNIISGNGVPMDRTLMTGGVRNDNIGLVLDARGNDWGDASGPYAGPMHFLQPNPSGKGNAVSDWVLYDVHTRPTIPPMVPPFGSLLDGFERGSGHPHTPGDVLAIGPGFTYNGALFDPYFFDLFQTAFALAEAQGGGNFAIDYAVCYLGDMWKADSCKIAPGSKP